MEAQTCLLSSHYIPLVWYWSSSSNEKVPCCLSESQNNWQTLLLPFQPYFKLASRAEPFSYIGFSWKWSTAVSCRKDFMLDYTRLLITMRWVPFTMPSKVLEWPISTVAICFLLFQDRNYGAICWVWSFPHCCSINHGNADPLMKLLKHSVSTANEHVAWKKKGVAMHRLLWVHMNEWSFPILNQTIKIRIMLCNLL